MLSFWYIIIFPRLYKRSLETFKIPFYTKSEVIYIHIFFPPLKQSCIMGSPFSASCSRLVAFWAAWLISWDLCSRLFSLSQCFLNKVTLSFLVYSLILERHNFKQSSENDTWEEILRTCISGKCNLLPSHLINNLARYGIVCQK